MGIEFQILDIEILETPHPQESPIEYSRRMTQEKLFAARLYIKDHQLPALPILCADTEVVMAGKIYGKPKDFDDAHQMLKSYSSQKHQVMTSIGLYFIHISK